MMETREQLVTVNISVTVILYILTTCGIVMTAVFLIVACVFRNRRSFRHAFGSPILSYVIGAGAVLQYLGVYFMAFPSTDPTRVAVSCNLSFWLTSLGFSLCTGTITVKMFRMYYIFINPFSRIMKDKHLALFVIALVVVDVVILSVYTLVDGLMGNLEPTKVISAENPSYTLQAREVEFQYFIYLCTSSARDIVLGLLYGYKFLLHAAAVLLVVTIKTKKINRFTLKEYQKLVMATYVHSLMLVIVLIFNYTAKDRINLYTMVTSYSLSIGITAIMVVIFVPEMVELYQGPYGSQSFSQTTKYSKTQNETKVTVLSTGASQKST